MTAERGDWISDLLTTNRNEPTTTHTLNPIFHYKKQCVLAIGSISPRQKYRITAKHCFLHGVWSGCDVGGRGRGGYQEIYKLKRQKMTYRFRLFNPVSPKKLNIIIDIKEIFFILSILLKQIYKYQIKFQIKKKTILKYRLNSL